MKCKLSFYLSCRKKLDRGAGWKVLGCVLVRCVRARACGDRLLGHVSLVVGDVD